MAKKKEVKKKEIKEKKSPHKTIHKILHETTNDTPHKTLNKAPQKSHIDKALLDNFINLQKVLTNLAVKFEDLSNNISKLLQLFELSAKSFADKPIKTAGIDEEFLKKLDSLLDQNKTISKGIMLMEERVRNRSTGHPMPTNFRGPTRPAPRY